MSNSDVVVLDNRVDAATWIIHLHVMAAKQDDLQGWADDHYPEHRFDFLADNLRMWHIRDSWPARDLIEYQHAIGRRAFVCWPLVAWSYSDQRVSDAMIAAGELFAMSTGQDPLYAFIRDIPARASEFVEVQGICLVQAGWVPNCFLAVGRGGMQRKG